MFIPGFLLTNKILDDDEIRHIVVNSGAYNRQRSGEQRIDNFYSSPRPIKGKRRFNEVDEIGVYRTEFIDWETAQIGTYALIDVRGHEDDDRVPEVFAIKWTDKGLISGVDFKNEIIGDKGCFIYTILCHW